MRGRKPRPRAQKKKAGNPGKRKLNKNAPEPKKVGADVPAPEHLSPEERELWGEWADRLAKLGVLTETDLLALEGLVIHMALVRQAAQALRDGLPIVYESEGKHGWMRRQEPVVQVLKSAWSSAWAIMASMGLTPADRERVRRSLADDDDPVAAAMRKARAARDGEALPN